MLEEYLPDVTDFFINACAAGYAKEALSVLEEFPQAELEPLVVGVQIFLGESPRTAQEILEVGKDVAQRIEERKQA